MAKASNESLEAPLLDGGPEEDSYYTAATSIPHSKASYSKVSILNCFCLACNALFACFWLLRSSKVMDIASCVKQTSSFSPAIEVASNYKDIVFDGSIFATSPFRGELTADLDAAWENITNIKYVPLSASDLRYLGKSEETAVKFPPEAGGEYAGLIEVFHQLHCLDTLRKAAHADHYASSLFIGNQSSSEFLRHLDHCTEIIRQVLMCNADVGVVTFNWVTWLDHPTPDFNTKHRCRDFDDIWQWNNIHAPQQIPFRKTGGEVELDHYP